MPRRLATDRMREIRQAERSHRRMQADITAETAQREVRHKQVRIETESELAKGRRNRAFQGKVLETATPSSDTNLIMTTMFVIAGLIVFYMLVTNSGGTSKWFGFLGTSLHALSSNKPLFTTTAKGTS